MNPVIDVTVAAVIQRQDSFLIVEEMVGGRRVFNQPAGHVEEGESLEEAAVREVLEETGYRFTPLALVGLFTWRGESKSYLRIAFSGEAEAPSAPAQLDDGIIAAHWLSRQELLQRAAMLRSPMVMRCIERHDEGIQYPLSFVNELLPHIEGLARYG